MVVAGDWESLETGSRWRLGVSGDAFELVKETEMERFGEKSYFYRKMNGLSPADSDDDPDLVGDNVRAHGFEEPEGEEDVGALEAGGLLL